MLEIAALPFWSETDAIALTPFTDADYGEFNIPTSAKNGVQAKQFVKDASGDAWLIKSGALGEKHPDNLTREEEKSRRAAFPIHQALASLLLRAVGVLVNEVGLGFRTMNIEEPRETVRLLVSIHRMQRARRRDHVSGFLPSIEFVDDLFTMLCVNRVIGQGDHQLHNYMVSETGRLLAVDNGACMKGDWLSRDCTTDDFDRIESLEETARMWTDQARTRIKGRLRPLTGKVVDAAFSALPAAAVAWHDQDVGPEFYAVGTIAEKQARINANVAVLRRWGGYG
jgi:hypothetical protein